VRLVSFDPTNTFILSPNDKGDNPKRPDYRGTVNIAGVVYELAGWKRERRDGKGSFVSGPVKLQEKRDDAPKPPPEPIGAQSEPSATQGRLDEDVPF